MGCITTVTILNDAWEDMKKNKEQFFKNIALGMDGIDYHGNCKKINHYGIGHCGSGYMQVATSHHSDTNRLYLVGQNLMTTFGYSNDITDLELRKELLKKAELIIKKEKELIKELEQKAKENKVNE